MTLEIPDLYRKKTEYSQARLTDLRDRIAAIEAVSRIPELTIFVAGSFARYEASEHSDLDLFFVCRGDRSEEDGSRTNELEMFGDLIRTAKEMAFPRFSGDARYLEVHAASDIMETLGSRQDDAQNHFTLRLLMMLESRPLFGDAIYQRVIEEFVDSYFRDYPDHQTTFEPTFLINDISRYWRTLLANYEHIRNQMESEEERIRQKVRNYKLKYSRLTTCFATVAALASFDTPVEPEQVRQVIDLTPRQRLELVAARRGGALESVQGIIDGYADFLAMTELPTVDLERHFRDKQSRGELFAAASRYGDSMFDLLLKLDGLQNNVHRRILRTLVV